MCCFKVFLLIPLLIANTIATNDDFDCTNYLAIECPFDCETQICASTGQCERWFCNECELNVENCNAKENHEGPWKIVPNGECECPKRCQNVYNPVCAYYQGNPRLFASQCALNRINCETNTDWEKDSIEVCDPIYAPDQCVDICTKEYFPICAYNGDCFETFANECEFNLANCLQSNIWGAFYIGRCPDCVNKCGDHAKI